MKLDQYQVLVVDDEPDIRGLVKDILEDEGLRVYIAASTDAARKQLLKNKPDLVLLDIWMSEEDGLSLLKEWHSAGGVQFPVLVMSGHGTVETAVEATRLGAVGFIEKPLTTAKLLQSVRNILPETVSMAPTKNISRGYELVGGSEVMNHLRRQAEQIARSDEPIWINGEIGTRREVLAEYIHSLSPHSNSSLFVYVSGAGQSLEDAHDKVLCIDRDRLSPKDESQLISMLKKTPEMFLRVIIQQQDKYTGRNMAETATDDILFDLITPLVIKMPALRNHAEDIPELLHSCTDYHCQHNHLSYRAFSIAAQNYLFHYHWPGNLTELDVLVHDLLTSASSGEITLNEVKDVLQHSQLPEDWFDTVMDKPIREAREMFEKIYLERQLECVGGNISHLAAKADMERTHLYRKLRALGIRYNTGRKSE